MESARLQSLAASVPPIQGSREAARSNGRLQSRFPLRSDPGSSLPTSNEIKRAEIFGVAAARKDNAAVEISVRIGVPEQIAAVQTFVVEENLTDTGAFELCGVITGHAVALALV